MKPKTLLVSITGRRERDWRRKLKEIEQHKLDEVALFIEVFPPAERKGLFNALKKSRIKKIPLVHARSDTTRADMLFLKKNFGTRFFTIHEEHFQKKIFRHWKGLERNLYLEMSSDNWVAPYVKVEKIGGFCVDLAHFKHEVRSQAEEYRYIVEHLAGSPCACNHLSGYSYKCNRDMHTVHDKRSFNYLKTLPHNIFGSVIAVEIFSPIRDQLRYRDYCKALLTKELGFNIKLG